MYTTSRALTRPEQGFSFAAHATALVCLVVMFVGLAQMLPIGQETPLVDEPIFASSAFEFARSGEVVISNLSAPIAVFDTVWGGLFAQLFGETYWALRLSTIVLTALSAPFMYLLCRNLGGSPRLSLLGTSAYLFAPLVFVLSLTFQTDAHFVALTVMALGLTSRALADDRHWLLALFGGSVFVTLAFLSRPQALIVTIASALTWAWFGPKGSKGSGVVATTVIPLVGLLAYSTWANAVGQPYVREVYNGFLSSMEPRFLLAYGSQSLVQAATFLGFFTFPFLPLTLASVRRGWSTHPRLSATVGAGLVAIVAALSLTGKSPFHFQTWVADTGFLAVDRSFLGSRSALPGWASISLTAVFAGSTGALIIALFDKIHSTAIKATTSFASLTAAGFIAGAALSSMNVHALILDRYWLPVIPLAIGLAVAASHPITRRLVLSATLVIVMWVVTLVGAHDAFNTYREAAAFADHAVSEGIDPLRLEAGASWAAATFGLRDDDPDHLSRPGPFWVKFYAVETDPEFAVTLEPLDGYTVIERREYSSILHPGPDYLYLVYRDPNLPFYLRVEDF